jgi:hypothetical protein
MNQTSVETLTEQRHHAYPKHVHRDAGLNKYTKEQINQANGKTVAIPKISSINRDDNHDIQ